MLLLTKKEMRVWKDLKGLQDIHANLTVKVTLRVTEAKEVVSVHPAGYTFTGQDRLAILSLIRKRVLLKTTTLESGTGTTDVYVLSTHLYIKGES